MRPSGRARVRIVVAVYAVAVAVALQRRIAGDEAAPLGTVLLAAAGLWAVLQLNRPGRVRLWWTATLTVGLLTALGAYVGAELIPGDVPRSGGEFGAAVGAGVGVLTAAVLYWLRHLMRLVRPGPKVVISYRRSDAPAEARTLHRALTGGQPSSRIFLDIDSMQPGRDFRAQLAAVIRRCDVLVAVVGPGWVGARHRDGRRRLLDVDDPVRAEIEAAQDAGIAIATLRVRGAAPLSPDDLPPTLDGLGARPSITVADDTDTAWAAAVREIRRAAAPPRLTRTRRHWWGVAAAVAVAALPVAWEALEAATADSRAVVAQALTPDTTTLATAHGRGTSHTLRLWSTVSGEQTAVLTYTGGAATRMSWSPDGARLAVADRDGAVRIWSLPAGEDRELRVPGLTGMTWSPAGDLLAVADATGRLAVLDVTTGAPVAVAEGLGAVRAVGWAPRAAEIAVGTDRQLLVLTLRDGTLGPRVLAPRAAGTDGIAWSPDGVWLAAFLDAAPYLLVHDVANGRTGFLDDGRSFNGADTGADTALRFSPDSTALAANGTYERIRLWNPGTGGRIWEVSTYAWRPGIAWTPDGATVATASNRALVLVDAPTGDVVGQVWTDRSVTVTGWGPDGRLLTRRIAGGETRIWAVGGGEPQVIGRVSTLSALLEAA